MLLLFILATATYAFTAGNTVPATKAGQGVNTISGYAVTNVDYALDTNDASNVSGVTFDLDAAADTVQARVNTNATDGAWMACSNSTSFTWVCTLTAPEPINPITELEIVAVD